MPPTYQVVAEWLRQKRRRLVFGSRFGVSGVRGRAGGGGVADPSGGGCGVRGACAPNLVCPRDCIPKYIAPELRPVVESNPDTTLDAEALIVRRSPFFDATVAAGGFVLADWTVQAGTFVLAGGNLDSSALGPVGAIPDARATWNGLAAAPRTNYTAVRCTTSMTAIPGGLSASIIIRWTEAAGGSGYELNLVEFFGFTTPTLYRVTGGARVAIGAGLAFGWVAGDAIQLAARGSSFRVLLNGTSIIGPVVDGLGRTAGLVGVGSDTAGATFDSWIIDDRNIGPI